MTPTDRLRHVDEKVQLKTAIPELGLQGGEAGYVCSVWFAPSTTYEVEFHRPGLNFPVRALLLESQIGTLSEVAVHE
jgi:hypothetical protein